LTEAELEEIEPLTAWIRTLQTDKGSCAMFHGLAWTAPVLLSWRH
jgi:hypothetical protein